MPILNFFFSWALPGLIIAGGSYSLWTGKINSRDGGPVYAGIWGRLIGLALIGFGLAWIHMARIANGHWNR